MNSVKCFQFYLNSELIASCLQSFSELLYLPSLFQTSLLTLLQFWKKKEEEEERGEKKGVEEERGEIAQQPQWENTP